MRLCECEFLGNVCLFVCGLCLCVCLRMRDVRISVLYMNVDCVCVG